MKLKLFPKYIDNTSSREFRTSEVIQIRNIFIEYILNYSNLSSHKYIKL